MTTYAIRFDYPEGTLYAGLYKGALGWAPQLATALLFEDADRAKATLDNGYGASAKWGKVVPVTA
jgi:hypothetical protein